MVGDAPAPPAESRAGFTLLEMMVVLTIIVTIVSIAVPFYSSAIVRARESVLR